LLSIGRLVVRPLYRLGKSPGFIHEGDPTMVITKRTNAVLWIVQGVLALLFLFAGGVKLVLPLDALKGPISLPGPFLRFIGLAEVLGALGLILPGLLRIRPGLTSLAAAGLVIIMSGATVITMLGGPVGPAMVPLTVGILAAWVAFGRSGQLDIALRTHLTLT
jgi:hypothetical protein